MNKIFKTVISCIFIISCHTGAKYEKEFYSNGNLKSKIQINQDGLRDGIYEEYYESGELRLYSEYFNNKMSDSIRYFYKNGNIKEKGLTKNNLKKGWWFYYNLDGSLNKKTEYKLFNDTIYKNQIIFFKYNKILEARSSYFKINLPDTVKLGKSLGQVSHYSSNFKSDFNLISVVIENQYSANEKKKDTFSDGTLTPNFGINTYKVGKQRISGIIIEEILDKESTTLQIRKHIKYFEKYVFVK